MKLPTIQYATFTLVEPYTKKQIKFRPFTVKEDRLILQNQVMEDIVAHVNTMCDVIDSCSDYKIESRTLPASSIEYLFLQLRARSKSEIIPIIYTCYKPTGNRIKNEDEVEVDELCNTKIPYKININDIKLIVPDDYDTKRIIFLNDDKTQGIKFREPDFINKKINTIDSKETVNDTFTQDENYIYLCVESIFDNEDITLPEQDFNIIEFIDWCETIPKNKISDINNFFESLPYISLKDTLTCPKCGNTAELEFNNFEDFLD